MTAAAIAIVAALVALVAAGLTLSALARMRRRARTLEQEIERGKTEFDTVVAAEVAERSQELERTLARLRADALSGYADEERRIAEERRRDVAEREREATAKLGEQLLAAQRAVEQRLAEWASDVEKLQEGLTVEVKKLETKQRQLIADVEGRIGQEAEAQHTLIDEERASVARLREELAKLAHDVLQAASTELEQHAGERRRALQELADRMRRRERDLQEIIEREGNEAAQRIQMALGDVERRQVEASGASWNVRPRVTRRLRPSSSTQRSGRRARRRRAGSAASSSWLSSGSRVRLRWCCRSASPRSATQRPRGSRNGSAGSSGRSSETVTTRSRRSKTAPTRSS